MKKYFYFERDKDNNPVITVCLIEFDGVYSRGWSICSLKETPVKKDGKRRALARASAANFSKKNSMPVSRVEATDVLRRVISVMDPDFKSEYNVELTEKELAIVSHGDAWDADRDVKAVHKATETGDTWEVNLVNEQTGEVLEKMVFEKSVIEDLISISLKQALEAIIKRERAKKEKK
jgi:hypothetical protein